MVLLDAMMAKLRNGYSIIHLIVGEQRVGKTWFAIWLAEQLQPDFDVETGLVTNIEDFGKVFGKKNRQVIILDEAGISLDPMRSAEVTQRVYSHIIQSQAFRQNVVFLVLPCASDFGYTHKVHIYSETEVLGRNIFGSRIRNYILFKWRANPNDTKVKLAHIETKTDVPSPSDKNKYKYMGKKQGTDKDSILANEMLRLDMAREKEFYKRRRYELKKVVKVVEEKKPKSLK